MRLVDQWQTIERGLPTGWSDARVTLEVDAAQADRAATLLGPLTPGRAGTTLRCHAARAGAGPTPGAVKNGLARLDREGIRGTLELAGTGERARGEQTAERTALTASWAAELDALPDDWSDLYVELELRASDHLERAALLCSPVNPAANGGRGLRFRCARKFGYGVSPAMVRRCLERMDEEGIPGSVTVLRALSDTDPVGTQGPVWYVGGKAV